MNYSYIIISFFSHTVLWGLAIAYDYAQKDEKQFYIYIGVEVLVGIIMPILVVIMSAIFSIFLEYITKGYINPRVIIPKFLPVVKLVESSEGTQYWTILDHFYFELKYKKEGRCSGYCSHTPATWILTIILSLAFLLAASYFMNQNITQQVTLRSCPDSSTKLDCFDGTHFKYIDCNASNVTFDVIHCFKFLRLGKDNDIIGAVASSFAFYLVLLAFFSALVHIAEILNAFQPSKRWGCGFVVFAILMIFIMIVAVIVLIVLEFSTLEIIVQIVHVIIIAAFIFLTGLLLINSKSWRCKNKSNEPSGP